MVVSDVIRKRSKVTVKFDNDDEIIIPYDVYLKKYLSKNDIVTKKELKELEQEIEIYLIKQSSFRYLSGRNHSKKELELKLFKKNYNRSLVNSVINDLERQNLVNDENFAEEFFIAQQKRKRGLLKIKAELFKKGINREIIDFVSSKHHEDSIFWESAKLVAAKKYISLKKRNIESRKIKEKMYRFLSGRGFSPEIVQETIKGLEINTYE